MHSMALKLISLEVRYERKENNTLKCSLSDIFLSMRQFTFVLAVHVIVTNHEDIDCTIII